MNEEIKKTFIFLLVIGVIIGIGYFGYQYYKKETPKEVDKTEKTELQKERVIRELAEKYDALTNWNKDIHYTIQLQDLLVNSDRPVLFTGSIDDIFRRHDQYYIRFRTGGWEQWIWGLESEFSATQVYFILKCDSNKALEVINKRAKFDNYVVVAKIENVTKPTLQISGYSGIESEEVELEYEPSNTFIATGICVDFVSIEEDEDNKFSE